MLEAEQFQSPAPALDALPLLRHHRPARLWLRLKLVWRAPALDRDLAAGGPPGRDELHASRALQLLSPVYRRHVAQGLEKAARRRRDEDDALLDLAARLLSPRPVRAQGVAIAVLLLSEPDSPLHEPRARPGALGALARMALYRL